MIDDRTRELIHAGLDGELDRAGAGELAERLQQSAEARRYQESMIELTAAIGQQPVEDLPDGLHRRIVSRIELPAAHSNRPALAWMPVFGRYGLAAAAGLLIAVGIYEFGPGAPTAQDLSGMSGTILPADRSEAVVIDQFSFDDDQLSSALRLERRDGKLFLDVLLHSGFPVTMSLDFAGDGLHFDAISQVQGELDLIEIADQVLQVQGSGQHHFTVMLRRDQALDSEPQSIRVDYLKGDKSLNKSVLMLKRPD